MPFIVCFRPCSPSASPRRPARFVPALLLTALLALVLRAAPAAQAATFSVSTVAQLDAAVGSAQNGDTIQIAAGTYNLDQTLQPHNGVTLAGAGASSTALDGGGSIAILFVNPSVSVSLTRLTLQHGDGNNIPGSTQGCGGGVYNDSGTATLTDCTFFGNSSNAGFGGAAIFNYLGAVTLTRCTLRNNTVQGSNVVGGGAILNAGSLILASCNFSGNEAIGHAAPGDTTGYADGGAILSAVFSSSQAASTVTATACTFTGNNADYGGAIDNNATSQATLTGCTFTQNQAVFGAGFDNVDHATAALTGCTFTGNDAQYGGGGVYNLHTLTLTGCTLSGNSATNEGGALDNEGGGTVTVTNCTLATNKTAGATGGYGTGGGAIANGAGSTATLTGCTLTGNSVTGGYDYGGAVFSYKATLTLAGCTLTGNSATGQYSYGGGVDSGGEGANEGGTATVTNCAFNGNSASQTGGGFSNPSGTATVTNCTFSGNSCTGSAGSGGAVYNGVGTTTLTGSTLSGNIASIGGGFADAGGGSETLANDILWGDTGSNHRYGSAEFSKTLEGDTQSISYCDIQGGIPFTATDGGNNLNTDPQFVRAAGTNGSSDPGDLHLRYGSPVINRGTSQAPGYLPTDIQGVNRLTPPTIGAYEGYEIVVTNTNASGSGSLAVAVSDTNGQPDAVITFDPSVFGASGQDTPKTINLNGTLTYNNNNTLATILGPAPGVVLDGGNANRIFSITGGASVTLRGIQFQHGSASNGFGGGLFVESNSVAVLTDCVFGKNSAASGGAVFNRGEVILTNCVLLGNSATYGGGFYNAGTAAVTECTLTGNSATYGGGVCNGNQSADYLALTDDILYGDTASSGPEVYTFSAAVDAAFCDIQGGVTAAVSDDGGNFSANPLFVASYSNGTNNYDLHVSPGSPCVGAGTTNAVAYQPVDITGVPRADPPTVGAYEGQKAGTKTSLSSSLNPSVYGQSVTFTATVNTYGGPTPQGSVQFSVDGVNTGTPVPLSGTQATFATSALGTGGHTVTATFTGAGFQTSSASLTQTVLIANTTALASSLNPSVYGQSVTFTATVDTHGGPAPQGSVQFAVDGVNMGSPVPLSGTQATFATSTLALGGHTITATFTGAGFQTSGASLTQTVNPASVTSVAVGWGSQTAPLTTGTALPWAGIKTLVVTLNGPAGLSPGDITLAGKAVASYGPVTISQAASVYTVTLAKPITAPDRLTLTLGNAGVNSYSASFTVLPGDVNGDGMVNASDMALVKNAIGGAYKQIDDLDGSGAVDSADYNAVRQRVGTKLP